MHNRQVGSAREPALGGAILNTPQLPVLRAFYAVNKK